MTVAYNKCNIFVQDVANKVHNLASDTFKVALTNTAPTAATTNYSGIVDLSTANGYTAGGTAVVITSSTQTSGTLKWLVGVLVVVTASGAVGPFRYAFLYNSTAGGNAIAWYDYGSNVTLASGDSFTVNFDQSNGVLQIA